MRAARPRITRNALCVVNGEFDPKITEQLTKWETSGYLKILCDPNRNNGRSTNYRNAKLYR